MITFLLSRQENTESYCMGRLFIRVPDSEPRLLCDTLEPPSRPFGPAVKAKTAVPAGSYDLDLTLSPKFGRQLPILVGVPAMSGVRIHRGNTAADTAGCILPGRYVAPGRLVESTPAEIRIVQMLLHDPEAVINISDDFLDPSQPADEDLATPLRPFAASLPIRRLVPAHVWACLAA